MIVVDGHLDLAFNHFAFGRDPRQSAYATRAREGDRAKEPFRGSCMSGLPEMREGRVAVVFPTLFLARRKDELPVDHPEPVTYGTAEEAEECGRRQLDYYQRLSRDEGSGFRVIAARGDLEEVVSAWEKTEGAGGVGADGHGPDVGLVPLMEGADPIRRPADARGWFERGIRIVGLSWRGTRYAGGTGEPGPLTPEGRRLVRELDVAGLVLDLSHAAEESFFEALDLYERPAIASHANPRKLCPGDRQLSDPMIRRIAERGGVIGAVPFNRMLVEGWADRGRPEVPLARFAEAVQHVAGVAGTHEAVAVGSDFDGGFGAESAPRGLDTIADLSRIGDALADASFTDDQIHDILGRNWIRFLRQNLP